MTELNSQSLIVVAGQIESATSVGCYVKADYRNPLPPISAAKWHLDFTLSNAR